MDPIVLLALAVLAAVAGMWLWSRRGSGEEGEDASPRAQRVDTLDTVAAWPPEVTRVLTLQERRAYSLLTHALPDHLVLAQVPVSRFIRVPTRNSYHEWMRRVGQLCADLVICDPASQVIAVVEVRRPPSKDSERTRKRHDRMDRVLRKAGVRVIEWNEEVLPHRDAVREQILPTPKAASEEGALVGPRPPLPYAGGAAVPSTAAAMARSVPAGLVPAAAATTPRVAAARGARLDEALEAIDQSSRREGFAPAEPTPSTWFDELESDRMPLDRHRT